MKIIEYTIIAVVLAAYYAAHLWLCDYDGGPDESYIYSE